MAEAGWPLRTETFYYSHRKGGPQVLPVDVPAFLRSLLPRPADDDYRYLAEHSPDPDAPAAADNPVDVTRAHIEAFQA